MMMRALLQNRWLVWTIVFLAVAATVMWGTISSYLLEVERDAAEYEPPIIKQPQDLEKCEVGQEHIPNSCACPDSTVEKYLEYDDHTGVVCVVAE